MKIDRESSALPRRERNLAQRSMSGSELLNPINLMRRFSEEMDRLFGHFYTESGLYPSGFNLVSSLGRLGVPVNWSPAVDLFERDNNMIIRADLPGINPDDIKIEVEKDGLVIQGETKKEQEDEREGVFHSERSYGRFYRFIPLPENVNVDQITANINHGVLEVTIPQSEQARNKKQIPIQSGAQQAKAIGATGAAGNVGAGGASKDTEKKSTKV